MSVTISYDGDPADLVLNLGATIEIHETGTQRHVHGMNWDGNVSRLSFDPGTATNMVLTVRRAARWPRLRRRATRVRG